MGQDSTGRFFQDPVPFPNGNVASAARTSTVTLAAFNVEGAREIIGKLDITAASGTTPTLDVSLETTTDGTNWYTVGAIAQKTGVSNEERAFSSNLGIQCRWKFTIGGTTPSFTASITARARYAA